MYLHRKASPPRNWGLMATNQTLQMRNVRATRESLLDQPGYNHHEQLNKDQDSGQMQITVIVTGFH